MATINLGRIKPVWQGLWAASTAYVKDDIVRYDVDSYICTASHTSSADFASDSANWDLVAQGSTIPSQTGNAGTFLTTDGTDLSWSASDYVKLASIDSTTSVTGIGFPSVFSDNPDFNSYHIIVRHLRFSALSPLAVRLYDAPNSINSSSIYAYMGAGAYTGTSAANSRIGNSADSQWEFSDWNGFNTQSGRLDMTVSNMNDSSKPATFNALQFGVYNNFTYWWAYNSGGLIRNNNNFTGISLYGKTSNATEYAVDIYGIR